MNIQNILHQFNITLSKMKAYEHALGMLQWDLETEAPKLAIEKTSETIAFLVEENHKLLISDEMKNLIEILEENSNEISKLDQRVVKEIRKQYDRATKIPIDEYTEYQKLLTKAQHTWAEAKGKDDFKMFSPMLNDIINFNKKFIEYRGYEGHPYNTLLDDYEPGLTIEKADKFFKALRQRIVPLLKNIQNSKSEIDTSFFKEKFDLNKQKEFAKYIAKYIDFDFNKGVLKESVHPFTLHFDNKDVRITSRYFEDYLLSSIFSVLHEGGHAIYEQGISDAVSKTILGQGTSMGIHESQSRMYENLFGRTIEFWEPIYGKLLENFPSLNEVSLEDFYKAINKVETSLIRVEADELTYSLHVMIRYEIEKMLFEGDIDINDLPKIWNDKMEEYLGLRPDSNATGVLQDVHWSAGLFGYFPSYALGNAYASQMMNQIEKDLDIDELLRQGDFKTIKNYLGEKIHNYGMSKNPLEIITEMTGEELNPDYYCTYLEEKFSKIYNL